MSYSVIRLSCMILLYHMERKNKVFLFYLFYPNSSFFPVVEWGLQSVDLKKISYPPNFLDIDVYFSYVVCTLRKKINVKPRVRIKHNNFHGQIRRRSYLPSSNWVFLKITCVLTRLGTSEQVSFQRLEIVSRSVLSPNKNCHTVAHFTHMSTGLLELKVFFHVE
jgi:hypothetical protein